MKKWKRRLIHWLLNQLKAPVTYQINEDRYKVELIRTTKWIESDAIPREWVERECVRDIVNTLYEAKMITFEEHKWKDDPFGNKQIQVSAQIRFVIPKKL